MKEFKKEVCTDCPMTVCADTGKNARVKIVLKPPEHSFYMNPGANVKDCYL